MGVNYVKELFLQAMRFVYAFTDGKNKRLHKNIFHFEMLGQLHKLNGSKGWRENISLVIVCVG